MPMRRISSAVHAAQRFTSAACSGSALMLGIARYALSSSTYLSRFVLMKSMTLFTGAILPGSGTRDQEIQSRSLVGWPILEAEPEAEPKRPLGPGRGRDLSERVARRRTETGVRVAPAHRIGHVVGVDAE